MGVVSPFTATYAPPTIPYLTKAEFLATPTALELTDLIPGGVQGVQDQALRDAIQRASSWADTLANQILAATVDFDRGRYRVNRSGTILVPLKFKPVLEIQAISIGATGSTMLPVTDFSNVVPLDYGVVEVPCTLSGRVLVDTTYVNGWANTTLGAAASAGATAITMTGTTGIYPGSNLTIYDGASTENVKVSPTYVPGTASVALTAPIVYAHAIGVSVSAMPPKVKSAVALLATTLIQTRGNDAIILDSTENPGRVTSKYGVLGVNVEMAMALLSDLERVW